MITAFVLPSAVVLGAIVSEHPYFGLFDDWALLQVGGSLLHRTIHATHVDVSTWGMVRPFYPALADAYYSLGNRTVTGLYVATWLTVVAVLALLAVSFRRALRVPKRNRELFVASFGVACFAYPWTMYLFAYASLQEKWVLLAGALVVLWVGDVGRRRARLAWSFVTTLLIALGFATKAQFAVFVPVLLLLIAADPHDRRYRFRTVAAVSALLVVALAIVAHRGGYTSSKWRLADVEPQARSSTGVLFLGLLVVLVVAAIAAGRRRPLEERLRLFVPAVGLAGFLVIFLPWPMGLKSYTASVAVFTVGSAVGLAAVRLPLRVAWSAVVGLGVIAVLWSGYRADDLFGRLASVGDVARTPALHAAARTGSGVYVSCSEGRLAIAYYVRREQHRRLRLLGGVLEAGQSISTAAVPASATFAIVGRDCPAVLTREWRRVWTSGERNGLSLYQRR